MITEQVARDCNLVPTGKTIIGAFNGKHLADTYVVTIMLCGVVCFTSVTVTNGDFPGADVLIGMDIIGQGDFAITNRDEKTSFMFRFPSVGSIDFTEGSGYEED